VNIHGLSGGSIASNAKLYSREAEQERLAKAGMRNVVRLVTPRKKASG
jgi:hypothetical protein